MSDAAINALIKMIETHTDDDRENFKVIRESLVRIESHVSSLQQTRSFGQGASKVILWALGILATLGGGSVLTGFFSWLIRAR